MATIIIEGTKEECMKAEKGFKNLFSKIEKKADFKKDGEIMQVFDVYQERYGKDGFTDEEIELGLTCCTYVERKCPECPYRKESGCSSKLLADASARHVRMLNK